MAAGMQAIAGVRCVLFLLCLGSLGAFEPHKLAHFGIVCQNHMASRPYIRCSRPAWVGKSPTDFLGPLPVSECPAGVPRRAFGILLRMHLYSFCSIRLKRWRLRPAGVVSALWRPPPPPSGQGVMFSFVDMNKCQ